MTENEAIKGLETSINLTKMCTQNYERKREIQGYEMAINALEDVLQYRALEKRLSDMFCSSVSLKSVVDELERNLKEPDSPHPMKARILTYKESADWDAYRAIGTPEECRAAVKKQNVNQVVEQLEAYSNADEAERFGTMPVVELADAIKIVKGGGVDGD